MRINANISALNTHRQLGINQANTGRSVERLSSGLRINRAGDDAAGLAISEKMRGQVRGLNQATRNAQDGISLIQTAEGALTETHSILQRMRELAVQGGNDTLVAEDRTAISTELTELRAELNRIATTTQFNGQTLLDGRFGRTDAAPTATGFVGTPTATALPTAVGGTYTFTHSAAGEVTVVHPAGANATAPAATSSTITGLTATTASLTFGGVTVNFTTTDLAGAPGGTPFAGTVTVLETRNLQIGANHDQRLTIAIGDMGATALGVDPVAVTDHASANTAITLIDTAITRVSDQRSQLGAWQNRLDHTINNLGTSAENLTAAESRVRDVDMAQEMMEFTRNNILSQAAQAMLAQANQIPQGVLQLLR